MVLVDRGIIDRSAEFKSCAQNRRATISIPQEQATDDVSKKGLFKKKKSKKTQSLPPPPQKLTTDYSLGAESSMHMDVFYNHIALLHQNLKQVRELRGEAEKANRQYLLARDDDQANKCDDFVEECVNRVNQLCAQTRQTLDTLDGENDQLLGAPCPDKNEEGCRLGYARIRILNTAHLRAELAAQMAAFKAEQREAAARKQDQLARQLRIVDPTLSDGDVNRIATDPELTSAQLFALAASKTDATQALERLQQRHTSMLNIEKGVSKLAMLFQDMQNLVLEQGEMLNDTQKFLAETNTFLEQAIADTAEGAERQKTNRKLKCLLI